MTALQDKIEWPVYENRDKNIKRCAINSSMRITDESGE